MLEWIKIDVQIETQEYEPPFFIGSMLRGVIGHALKKVVCINPSYRCDGCFAAGECLFYKFYEAKNVFHAYRLEIPLKPKNIDFSLYLLESATTALPYVLSAIHKAIEEIGVGKAHRTFRLRSIRIGERIVHDGRHFTSLRDIVPNTLDIDTFYANITLQLTMPLRIKSGNRLTKNNIALHTLIGNIQSRYLQLKGEQPCKLGYRVRGEVTDSNLKFIEMRRYSNRQRIGMNIGGLMGTLHIKGIDKQSYLFLKIGEIIGAGKQTVFGLGQLKVKEIDTK